MSDDEIFSAPMDLARNTDRAICDSQTGGEPEIVEMDKFYVDLDLLYREATEITEATGHYTEFRGISGGAPWAIRVF